MGWTQVRHGREAALAELDKYYEGPLKGLQIAPQFYKMLGSADLKNTPLGRSLELQNQLLGEVSAGLGGSAFGARRGGRGGAGVLPPDLASAIGENLNANMSQLGIEGSPAAALTAASRYTGASEQIRAQRINEAMGVLGQVGGASIMPSASQFLSLGAQKAESAARYQYEGGIAEANARSASQQGRNQMYGQLLGMAASGALGGFAAPAGMGMAGILGGITGTGYQRFGGGGGGGGYGTGYGGSGMGYGGGGMSGLLGQWYNQQYNGTRPFQDESWRFGGQ